MQNRLILLLLAATFIFGCEPAEQLSGRARVVDGDSLEIAGTSIRLFGIDAFEGRQNCLRDGKAWHCGEAAAGRLRELVGSNSLTCEQRDTDRYGRTVARCMSGAIDLAAELALSGLALAYREYSLDYVDEEQEASAARRGAWAGEFQAPWRYRSNPQPVIEEPAPRAATDECLIKGNISSSGELIFHTPGSSSYAQTRIDESRGERWFCTEEEARTAGWRPPRGTD